MSTLYETNMLSWIFIMLIYWKQYVCRHIPPLGYLSLFQANQYFLILLNLKCLAEKQQIVILKPLALEANMLTIARPIQ